MQYVFNASFDSPTVPPGSLPLKGAPAGTMTVLPNGQMTIMRPAPGTTRYVDVDKYGVIGVTPQDRPLLPGQQFPIPYATLPVRQPMAPGTMRPRAGSQVSRFLDQFGWETEQPFLQKFNIFSCSAGLLSKRAILSEFKNSLSSFRRRFWKKVNTEIIITT